MRYPPFNQKKRWSQRNWTFKCKMTQVVEFIYFNFHYFPLHVFLQTQELRTNYTINRKITLNIEPSAPYYQ